MREARGGPARFWLSVTVWTGRDRREGYCDPERTGWVARDRCGGVGTRLEEAMGCVVLRGPSVRRWKNFLKFQLGRHFDERATTMPSVLQPRRKTWNC